MDYIEKTEDLKNYCRFRIGVGKDDEEENKVNGCWKLAEEKGQVKDNESDEKDDGDKMVVSEEDVNTKKGLTNMEDLGRACDLWLEKVNKFVKQLNGVKKKKNLTAWNLLKSIIPRIPVELMEKGLMTKTVNHL
ncbi:hypothetical protein C2G38_2035037 [Gigaspora rosea]|uniref:Uncharacterized protein n=1 Tax=Gigaspora rosea TaxID=44941 RepID=A0A397VFW1_9GLOM|nr:hypothetical protein C2G38_2035037 [Gigaspora rosea]